MDILVGKLSKSHWKQLIAMYSSSTVDFPFWITSAGRNKDPFLLCSFHWHQAVPDENGCCWSSVVGLPFFLNLLSPFPCSEAAAHAVATLAEATLQGGGQIVLSGETAAAVGALTGVQDANGKAAGKLLFCFCLNFIFIFCLRVFPLYF